MAGTSEGTSGAQKDDTVRCVECGSKRAAAEDAEQEITHCEWCGAEYPVPDED